MTRIKGKCEKKQIIISTHSAYVLNKLGLENLQLLAGNQVTKLTELPSDTQIYFKKLSGYDTLRLVLAKKAILVEGPSDELIVQKAYKAMHGKFPIEKGVDVINVRGLSFARFLDIAIALKKSVAIVTDNDGDYKENVENKYKPYVTKLGVKICASKDNNLNTLEPQMIKANSLKGMNDILNKTFKRESDLNKFMETNKTDWALKVFESDKHIKFPDYIDDAVKE